MAAAAAPPAAPRVLNINVGVLGHVDSGKTSLGERMGGHAHCGWFHHCRCLAAGTSKEWVASVSMSAQALGVLIPAAVAALSTMLSTAALDKHPQSKERGITLDLGFSSFSVRNVRGSKGYRLLSCWAREWQTKRADTPGLVVNPDAGTPGNRVWSR